MVDNPREADPFAAAADAILINFGTPYRDTAEAMIAAVTTAAANATPGFSTRSWRHVLTTNLRTPLGSVESVEIK
jgi:hypothetical protein